MSTFFDRLRRIGPKGVSSHGETVRETDLPLDHQLSFNREAGEQWNFRGDNRIYVGDEDVATMVNEGANDISLLCGLSEGLSEYREFVWSRGGKGHEKFNGAIFALQDKILGRLGNIYDNITGGVRFECDGNDFWINNVNVRSVLSLYKLRPTDKARHYLFGLKDKLGLILSSRNSSTRYDGVHAPAKKLFDEITRALEYLPADAPLCLPAGDSNL